MATNSRQWRQEYEKIVLKSSTLKAIRKARPKPSHTHITQMDSYIASLAAEFSRTNSVFLAFIVVMPENHAEVASDGHVREIIIYKVCKNQVENRIASIEASMYCPIAVGRSTRDHPIDVDLSLEGPAAKVSRKQATIRLRNSGDFFMSSEGKRPIFVDGRPILQGNKVKLNHNSVIEIAGLRFVFLVNQELISAIRQEAVKVNIPV